MGKKLNYPNFRNAMKRHGTSDDLSKSIFDENREAGLRGCSAGDHPAKDIVEADYRYVVYVGGEQLKTGDKYCRLCRSKL